MRLTISRKALSLALSQVAAISVRKSPHFAATAVLLSAANGRLELRTTNAVSASMRVSLQATTEEAGDVACNTADLVDRIGASGAEQLTISTTEKDVVIAGKGQRRFTLRKLPIADLPPFPVSSGEAVEVVGVVLADALSCVAHAMDLDSTKATHAAQISVGSDRVVRADATDSKRMALYDSAGWYASVLEAVIPAPMVPIIGSLAAGSTSVSFRLVGPTIFVAAGDAELNTQLVSGAFPPTRSIMGTFKVETKAKANRAELADAIKALSTNCEYVDVGMGADGISLVSVSPETGEDARDNVAAGVEGPSATATYYCAQMLQALGACSGGDVVVEMTAGGPGCTLVIRDGGAPAALRQFVIVPRVK